MNEKYKQNKQNPPLSLTPACLRTHTQINKKKLPNPDKFLDILQTFSLLGNNYSYSFALT